MGRGYGISSIPFLEVQISMKKPCEEFVASTEVRELNRRFPFRWCGYTSRQVAYARDADE